MARDMERRVRSSATKRKTKVGYRKTEAWQCEKIARYFLHWSSGCGVQRNYLITRGGSWKFRCQQQCLARSGVESRRKLVALLMLPRQKYACIVEADESTRKRFWKEPYTKIMKTILQGKELIHWATTISCTNLFLCLKQWKYQMRKQQWTKTGKNWHGSWRKSERKMRWSLKQGMRAKSCTSRHQWTSVISRIQS